MPRRPPDCGSRWSARAGSSAPRSSEACGAGPRTVAFAQRRPRRHRRRGGGRGDGAGAARRDRQRRAYTDVDAAEDHPITALNVNAFAVRALARAAETPWRRARPLQHRFRVRRRGLGAVHRGGSAESAQRVRGVEAARRVVRAGRAARVRPARREPVRQRGRADPSRRAASPPSTRRCWQAVAASLRRSHDFADLRDRRRARDAAAPRIVRAGRPVSLRQLRFVHAGSSSRRSWRGCSASSRALPRCAWRTCSFARRGRCTARCRTPSCEPPASTCRRGRTRWRGTSPLGACPSIRRSRAHGACTASSRREEEAMRAIVDDEQRRDRRQPPCALRVPASRGHLRRCRSSTMAPHRLRRGALHLPARSQERGPS